METMEKMSFFLELIWAHVVHADSEEKYISVLGQGTTQGLDDRTLWHIWYRWHIQQQKENILLILHKQEKDLY